MNRFLTIATLLFSLPLSVRLELSDCIPSNEKPGELDGFDSKPTILETAVWTFLPVLPLEVEILSPELNFCQFTSPDWTEVVNDAVTSSGMLLLETWGRPILKKPFNLLLLYLPNLLGHDFISYTIQIYKLVLKTLKKM